MARKTKKRFLVLDDDPVRHDAWIKLFCRQGHEYVRANTINEFNKALKTGKFDTIFLDHDLNDHPHLYTSLKKGDYYGWNNYLTGVDAAKEVVNLPEKHLPDSIVIHSWNPGGAQDIKDHLHPVAKKGVKILVRPFDWELYRKNAMKMSKEKKYVSIFNKEVLSTPTSRGSYYDHD
jgi:CheY-like chemotaxis protein